MVRRAVSLTEKEVLYHSPWTRISKSTFLFRIRELLKKSNAHWTQWIDAQLLPIELDVPEPAQVQDSTIDARSDDAISLLSLPPEVRKITYAYARNTSDVQWRRRQLVVNGILREHAGQPALTKTCSAIRCETLPIFYSQNGFVLVLDRVRALSLGNTELGVFDWL
jgi:hypothetical protein